MPKVLLLDIETAPNIGYFWGLFDQNISHEQIKEVSYILCWSAQWYGESAIAYREVLTRHRPRKAMLLGMHALLDQADIIIHFNGCKFDIPVLNKEFVKHKITPPSPYKQIDLYRVVKAMFRFESNKMTAIAKQLGIEEKLKHDGFQLWVGCMEGDKKCWQTMKAYNQHDVKMLDELYTLLIPWIPNHPKMNLDHPEACPRCGTKGTLQGRGTYVTSTLTYRRYYCRACGSWCRERIAEQGPRPIYV